MPLLYCAYTIVPWEANVELGFREKLQESTVFRDLKRPSEFLLTVELSLIGIFICFVLIFFRISSPPPPAPRTAAATTPTTPESPAAPVPATEPGTPPELIQLPDSPAPTTPSASSPPSPRDLSTPTPSTALPIEPELLEHLGPPALPATPVPQASPILPPPVVPEREDPAQSQQRRTDGEQPPMVPPKEREDPAQSQQRRTDGEQPPMVPLKEREDPAQSQQRRTDGEQPPMVPPKELQRLFDPEKRHDGPTESGEDVARAIEDDNDVVDDVRDFTSESKLVVDPTAPSLDVTSPDSVDFEMVMRESLNQVHQKVSQEVRDSVKTSQTPQNGGVEGMDNVMERASPVGRLLEVNTFPSSTYDPRGDAEAFHMREKFFERRRVQRAQEKACEKEPVPQRSMSHTHLPFTPSPSFQQLRFNDESISPLPSQALGRIDERFTAPYSISPPSSHHDESFTALSSSSLSRPMVPSKPSPSLIPQQDPPFRDDAWWGANLDRPPKPLPLLGTPLLSTPKPPKSALLASWLPSQTSLGLGVQNQQRSSSLPVHVSRIPKPVVRAVSLSNVGQATQHHFPSPHQGSNYESKLEFFPPSPPFAVTDSQWRSQIPSQSAIRNDKPSSTAPPYLRRTPVPAPVHNYRGAPNTTILVQPKSTNPYPSNQDHPDQDQDLTSRALNIIASDLGVTVTQIADAISFTDVGFDPERAIFIRGRLQDELGIELPDSLFMDCTNVGSLRDFLCQRIVSMF